MIGFYFVRHREAADRGDSPQYPVFILLVIARLQAVAICRLVNLLHTVNLNHLSAKPLIVK